MVGCLFQAICPFYLRCQIYWQKVLHTYYVLISVECVVLSSLSYIGNLYLLPVSWSVWLQWRLANYGLWVTFYLPPFFSSYGPQAKNDFTFLNGYILSWLHYICTYIMALILLLDFKTWNVYYLALGKVSQPLRYRFINFIFSKEPVSGFIDFSLLFFLFPFHWFSFWSLLFLFYLIWVSFALFT